MYAWVWRRLPGGFAGKLLSMTLLVAAVLAALWLGVFPWATTHLPIDRVGVGG